MKFVSLMVLFLNSKALKIEKRLRFVVSAFLLTMIMLISTLFFFDKAIFFIPILMISSYISTYFALLEEIEKIEWLMLFIMPIILSISFYLFYFLFPGRWLTRFPFILIYGISFYALLLTSNIFNVGVEKNLQLYRAAFSINFFYQTIISFLIFNIILSLRLNFLFNGILISLVGWLFSLQLLWTQKLKLHLEKEVILYSFFIGIIIFQAGLTLSFIPLNLSIFSLVLSASYYALVGLIYHSLDQKLFKETVREYLIVVGFVGLIAILSINW